MRAASQTERLTLQWNCEGDTLHIDVRMPTRAIAAITVELASEVRP